MSRAREPYFADNPSWVTTVGLKRHPMRDAYNLFLRAQWPYAIGAIVAAFLLVNVIFATLYYVVDGVDGAHGYADCFFFSVETLATVGYGAMHPVTIAAHLVTVLQIMTGILGLALTTGLVFGKFSMPTARVLFTKHMCVANYDGVPTLMFRLANERGGRVLNVEAHLTCGIEEKTAEGAVIYRMKDLRLHREKIATLSRTWLGMHSITPDSPLYGMDAQRLKQLDMEFLITLSGMEYPTAQPFQAAHSWVYDEVAFGARFADMLIDQPDGKSLVDFSKFDELVPAG